MGIQLPLKLPADATIEVEITITHEGRVLGRGFLDIDNEPNKPIKFQDAAHAVQAGSYEVLKRIWPEELDSSPNSRTMTDLQGEPSGD